MAKVIGAEGQRNLNYALRREEQKKSSQDSANARQRMALANNLSKLSMDPDIDDPKLAYLGAAAMADPTGLMGGIASAFGAVAQVKAQNQKRDAVKSRKESDAGLALDQFGNLYGEDEAEALRNTLTEDQLKDPDYIKTLSSMKKEQIDKERGDTKYTMGLANTALGLAERGVALDASELDLAGTRLDLEKAKTKALEIQEQKDQFQKRKPHYKSMMTRSPDQGGYGMSETMADSILISPTAFNSFFSKAMKDGMTDADKKKAWIEDPELRQEYGNNESLWMNSDQYPDRVITNRLDRAQAAPVVQFVQSMKVDLHSREKALPALAQQASQNSLNTLFPVVDPNGQYTQGFQNWYIQNAGSRGLETDDDDTTEERFKELVGQEGAEYVNSLSAVYQQEQRVRGGAEMEKVISTLNASHAPFANALRDVNTIRTDLRQQFENNPGLGKQVIQNPVYNDETVDAYGPGAVFPKAENGGWFVTVGKEGQFKNSMNVDMFGFGLETELMNPKTEQPMTLQGGDTLNTELLRQAGVHFKPRPQSKLNGGYRELTAEEKRRIIPALQGLSSPQRYGMQSGNQSEGMPSEEGASEKELFPPENEQPPPPKTKVYQQEPPKKFGTEASRRQAKKKTEKEARSSKIHSEFTSTVREQAEKLNLDPSVFNFDLETIGDTNNFGTLVSNEGKALKMGGIFEKTPQLYSGYMNYKQFRGAGKNKVMMYSQPIPVSEFIEKINQPDAGEELDLTDEQVEDYRELINAADQSYGK